MIDGAGAAAPRGGALGRVIGMGRRAGLLGLGSAGGALFSVALAMLTAYELGPAGFGVWAILLGAQGLILTILGLRTADTLASYLARYGRSTALRGRLPRIVKAALGAELVLRGSGGFVLVATAPVLENWFDLADLPLVPLVFLALHGLILGLDAVWLPIERAAGRLIRIAAFSAGSSGVALVLAAGFQLAGALSVSTLALALTASSAAFAVAKLFGITRFLAVQAADRTGSAGRGLRGRTLRPFLATLLHGYWSSVLGGIVKQTDVLIVGSIWGTSESGVYRLAKSVVGPLSLAGQALAASAFVELSEALLNRDARRARGFVLQSAWLTLPAVAVGALILVGLQAAGLGARLGPYQETLGATIILYLGISASLILFWVSPAAVILRRMQLILVSNLAVAAGYLAVVLVATPMFGAKGAAAAMAFAWLFGHLILALGLSGAFWTRAGRSALPQAPATPR